MSASFTPGPWVAVEGVLTNDILICGNRHGNNAETDVVVVLGGKADLRSEANAHLIAAAPELYEALDRLIATDAIMSRSQATRVRALLAKARGAAQARGEQ